MQLRADRGQSLVERVGNMSAGKPQLQTAGRLHDTIGSERQVAIGGHIGHDTASADRHRPTAPAVGKRGSDKPFDKPGVGSGRIAVPEDDEIGAVTEFLPDGGHLAGPCDRGPGGVG